HASGYVAASMVIAIAACGLALWLAAGRGGRPPLVLSAIAFGIAVSGMHYTAMEGMTLFPHAAAAAATAPALSSDLLAIVVSVAAFCMSGIFLLFLVPDRSLEVSEPAEDAGLYPAVAAVSAAAAANGSNTAELGRGTYGPLGGAGGPPARKARHL